MSNVVGTCGCDCSPTVKYMEWYSYSKMEYKRKLVTYKKKIIKGLFKIF